MKSRFDVTDIQHAGIEYHEGSVEIDDDAHEIVFRAIKKSLFSSKEITLETVSYNARVFPQFEIDYLNAGNVSVWVSDELERQKITELLTKPRRELISKLSENLNKAESALRTMLMERADALDYLSEIRINPRKTLFETHPEILASSENPVGLVVQKQKEAIAVSLSMFKDNLSTQAANGELDAKSYDQFCRLALSIGATQDAAFLADDQRLRAAEEILHEANLTMPEVKGVPIRSFTETLLAEVISRIHGAMLEEALRTS